MLDYQNLALCRVYSSLPSVFSRALGKELCCRVPKEKHSEKKNTQRRGFFAECKKTLGKDLLCRVFFF